MSTVERVEILEEQVKKEIEITPPDTCVFCMENPAYWNELFQLIYQLKVGKEVEASTPCIHRTDEWLLWSHETAHFIGASFRDIAKNLDGDFITDSLYDSAKMLKQFDSMYDRVKNHSLWFELHKKVQETDKPRFQYMEDFDEYVDEEKNKRMIQTKIEYDKAKECLEFIKKRS